MKIISFNLVQVLTIISLTFVLIFSYSLFNQQNHQLNNELDKPSKLFFEGLYLGFNFTPKFETINKANRFNLNLTQLDESFNVLGQSMIYPEKLELAVKLIYSFFKNLKKSIRPSDKDGQYILDQHLLIFKDLETFQTKAVQAYFDTDISPLLFYWDTQDLYPYGLFKEYGINIAHTTKLMIPAE